MRVQAAAKAEPSSGSCELAGLPTVGIRLLLLLLLFFPLNLSPVSAQGTRAPNITASEQRVALVIGNAAYKEAPLKNPLNDARQMGATLQTLGFDVTLLEDASGRQMQRAILGFGEKLRAGGAGLFYYAGHGLQVKGRNYLVPVDAAIGSEAAVRIEAVDVELVTEQLGDAAARVSIVILDACRDNPFERKLRGGSRGLAAIDAASGTLIAYATAPGSVAADGTGENGVYTEELLNALKQPDLKIEEVFKRVRTAVVQRTKGRQTPWESSSLTGDFVFNLTISLPPPVVSGFDERQIELAYWSAVKDSTDPSDFQEFLARFPKGSFRPLAERALKVLQSAAAAPPAAKVPSEKGPERPAEGMASIVSPAADPPTPARKPAPPARVLEEGKRKADQTARQEAADRARGEESRTTEERRNAEVAMLEPKAAAPERSSLKATRRFDGEWSGQVVCPATANGPSFQYLEQFSVKDGIVEKDYLRPGEAGYQRYRGTINPDGSVDVIVSGNFANRANQKTEGGVPYNNMYKGFFKENSFTGHFQKGRRCVSTATRSSTPGVVSRD